jgi:Ca2+/H+ antiporter, TMEM165/GDT1 family
MGDKTQLIALVLAARFKKPWPIMFGILVATLLNHAFASFVGSYVNQFVDANYLKWILASTFIGFGLWMLVPDKEEEVAEQKQWGPFVTTTIVFFLAEMGDKTQLATVALGAKFSAPVLVTLGTTLGMLLADGLAVFFGSKLLEKISMKTINKVASALFILFGIAIAIGY